MKFLLGLAMGVGSAALVIMLWLNTPHIEQSHDKKPLYWVAPMDDNYRRDGPGKSPMGMDLIPVYETANSNPGSVEISPAVENNLGVRTATVQKRKLDSSISTVGYVGYDQDTLVHLHPRVEGWVERLYVKAEGDPVRQGQALYDLYSPELVSAQEDLMLALSRGELRLIEGAKSRLRALKLAEKTIDALVQSRKVMQTVTYYAPQAGVVESLSIREGFYVQPGSTLMSIGGLDTVWIEADVFAQQTHLMRAGLAVDIQVPHLPGRHFTGELAYVYPSLNADTRTLRVRIRFNNRDRLLLPNMFAQLRISGDIGPEVLTLPRAAVIRTGIQNRVVLALGKGRFKSVAVQLGKMDQDYIEITDGLAVGDLVVVSGQFLLDSESSKHSDFLRMGSVDAEPKAVWVQGQVHAVDLVERKARVDHQAVTAWGWPTMVMDFTVADGVELEALPVHVNLEFELTKQAGNVVITATRAASETSDQLMSANLAEVDGTVNHLNSKTRIANISRAAIKKWNRPAATVNFRVADDIDITALKAGQKIRFQFLVNEGEFILQKIVSSQREIPTPMDHSAHQHGGQL
ncbi:efflux RND transporter periplasmic adaptor subunit [Simiduia curdlanivorans]|uniref:Efflux RND transporter periplasmic adaptor subunit n=1 Tax=Simiduia curdlanivorans TaxID=1492769 RepID=A0ABV8V7C9_9GAMM|nr:efflux RND transporter periplasmic adaptor subunit [Simiduia curdlanivorans]MDN3638681.1 efflux RND transporter periplasmic adaptor subunit [Simiduia curdlanivorans]